MSSAWQGLSRWGCVPWAQSPVPTGQAGVGVGEAQALALLRTRVEPFTVAVLFFGAGGSQTT